MVLADLQPVTYTAGVTAFCLHTKGQGFAGDNEKAYSLKSLVSFSQFKILSFIQ